LKYIIQKPSVAQIKIKKSEFVAYSYKINSTEIVNNLLKKLKLTHTNANHYCWAYNLYQDSKLIENYSDAGEPPGSAGMPILNILRSSNIVNCLIIVVRKFGGVKLGKKGLVNAYKMVSKQVIMESQLVKWEPLVQINLISSLNYYGSILELIKISGGKIISDYSGENVDILISIKELEYNNFKNRLNDATQNSCTIKK
jgi:uncharacterized YigZ family protein